MSENKLQIRMLKDGNRTVIVVDGPTKEMDEAAFTLIQQYYAAALQIELDSISATPPEPVSPLEDVPETPEASTPVVLHQQEAVIETVKNISAPSETIVTPTISKNAIDYSVARKRNNEVISDGKYKGMTTIEALQKYEERAFIDLIGYYKVAENEAEKEEIKKTLRQFMTELPNITEQFLTRERRESFLKTVSEEYNPVGFINGYPNMKSFITNASDEEINTATQSFAQALCARAYKR